MKELAPGVYADGDTIAFVVDEFLEAHGYEANEHNIRVLEDEWRKVATELGMKLEVRT